MDLVELQNLMLLCREHGVTMIKVGDTELVFGVGMPEPTIDPKVETEDGIPSEYAAAFGGRIPDFTKVDAGG